MAGARLIRQQLATAVVLLYSAIVIATIIPEFGRISNALVIPYYVFVPGYFVAVLLRTTGTVTERLFFTVAWSLTILAAFASLNSIFTSQVLPLNLLIPVLTVLLLIYTHYRK